MIAGFTAPRGTRPYLGALVLAVRNGKQWRYVGNVGAGFSHAMLAELHGELTPLITPQSPFATKVKNQGVTTWVKPKLVAEIKFTEWTTAGEMRHPVFLGLRTDKRAEDVVLEKELKRRPKSNNGRPLLIVDGDSFDIGLTTRFPRLSAGAATKARERSWVLRTTCYAFTKQNVRAPC